MDNKNALDIFVLALNNLTGLKFEVSAQDSGGRVVLSARSPTGFLVGNVNAFWTGKIWKFGGTSPLFPGAWETMCDLNKENE